MANGSHSGALDMDRDNWFVHRTWLLEQINSLSGKSPARVMALAEKMTKNRQDLGAYLDIMMSWLRDIVIFEHRPEKIIHKDLTDTIRYASQGADTSKLLAMIQSVQALQDGIRANANARLAVEALLLKMAAA
jgi:DNA polymerase III gamma/tau subunit